MGGHPAHGEERHEVFWGAGQGVKPALRGCKGNKALNFLESDVLLFQSAGTHTT